MSLYKTAEARTRSQCVHSDLLLRVALSQSQASTINVYVRCRERKKDSKVNQAEYGQKSTNTRCKSLLITVQVL